MQMNMESNTMNLVSLVISSIQIIVLLLGVLWAYFRFRKENPLYPRIELDLNCKFFGPQRTFYIASFAVSAHNKGNIEHKFDDIRLRVRGIISNDAITELKDYEPLVNFPEKLMSEVNIVPKKIGYYFVRPGVYQTFNYAARVSEDIRFIIVRITFKYQSTSEIHSAEKIFEVKV
jgi:hypothetical protein